MSAPSDVDGLTPLHAWTDAAPASAPTGAGVGRLRLWGEAAGAATAMAVALVLLLATGAAAYLYVPYSDTHDWAAEVFAAERTHAWLAYVWSPHTAQRIPWARLSEAAEIEAVRSRWPVFLWTAGFAWMLGLAAVLARVGGERALGVRTRVWLAAAAGLVLANVVMAEDLAEPISSLYLFSAGPAAAALCLVAGSPGQGLKAPAFWAALGLALAASGGGAAGLAVWPALAVVVALQPGARARLLVVGAVGLTVVAAVQGGLGLPSSSLGAGGGGGAHLVKQAVYFLSFCGLPWSRTVHATTLGALVGAPVALTAAWTLRDAWRARHGAGFRLQWIGAGLVAFGLLAALLAAVGRVDESPTPIVPMRYAPFAALLQLGVVLGASARLDRLLRRRADGASVAAAVLAGLVLVADGHGARLLLRTAEHVRAASRAFDAGAPTGDVVIHPVPALAHEVRAELRARGLPS